MQGYNGGSYFEDESNVYFAFVRETGDYNGLIGSFKLNAPYVGSNIAFNWFLEGDCARKASFRVLTIAGDQISAGGAFEENNAALGNSDGINNVILGFQCLFKVDGT